MIILVSNELCSTSKTMLALKEFFDRIEEDATYNTDTAKGWRVSKGSPYNLLWADNTIIDVTLREVPDSGAFDNTDGCLIKVVEVAGQAVIQNLTQKYTDCDIVPKDRQKSKG